MLIDKLSKRMSAFPPSGIRKVSFAAADLEAQGHSIIHMEMGMPDFDTPEYIKAGCIRGIQDGHVYYTASAGKQELRQAIADKLQRENSLSYTADEIVTTIGVSAAIFAMFTALLDEGDEVLLPDPVYPPYRSLPVMMGARTVSYALLEKNDFQPDLDEIERKITARTKVLVLLSPSNPVGSVLTYRSLEGIAKIAIQHDLLVITDEIYERILYDGAVHYSIATFPGMKERTFVLNGYSKTYAMTGWRLGYIAGPAEFMPYIYSLHGHMNTCAASFIQDAGITALTEEHDEVQRMVTAYQQRKDYLVQMLNAMDGLSCPNPKGAFYIFLNITGLGMNSVKAADFFLNQAHVALVPGSVFGQNGEGYLRMSFACSMEEIVEACRRMKKAIEQRNRNTI